MSSDIAIKVEDLGKCYQIYEKPRDRLKQFILPRINRICRRAAKNYYYEFWALKDISFQLKTGETLGIIGLNGSGKSTLLQMICGTLNSTKGGIQTNGRIAALLELGSGFNPEFTGRENVYLNASILGLKQEEIDARLSDIIEFADIGNFIDQPVKTYSSGMFVRLAFAVVAHVNAQILIIDEALAVGDVFFTQKCMRFLRQFKETGTLIFVSHDTGAVVGLCDTAIWLDHGRLKAIGPAKQVSEMYLASQYTSSNLDVSETPPNKKILSAPPQELRQDFRADLINNSLLRNDLSIYEFTPGNSTEFGIREAEIKNVALICFDGATLSHIVGGELVTLRIEAKTYKTIKNPIIGFAFKDRLGQPLFGDNTYLSHKDRIITVEANNTISAEFTFIMPILPCGDFTVAAAIASGSQESHIQHHWIHDALFIKSLATSVSTGLVGIPMHDIQLKI